MPPAITLLLGVHAHQPVGNFPEVIEDAHQRCYKPFLHTLHAYPDFRFAAHFSGWLLDWLRERHPADMALLAEMVRRGQVELFSSGDTEPVLAAIPHRDRIGQLQTLNDKLTAWTGVQPSGAWLTERVWESAVVPALAATGIRYVTVDDYHFFCTGQPATALDGYFSTEEDGTRLDLFPISEALRYRLPFSPAHEVIAYLEGLAEQGQVAAIYFDDIEKFGIWPETYDWVYHRGWLKALIEGVLASPKIRTATYADFHAGNATRGIVYLPTTSYSEMNEWTLPMPAARIYADFLAAEKAAGRGDLHRPFVRGGIWRNFLSRYPEANWMHKRMQGLSARLGEIPDPPPALVDDLYRAQANDAYWHGLFGGLWELPSLDAARALGVTVDPQVVALHDQVLTHRRLALEVVRGVKPAALEGSETRETVRKVAGKERTFTGLDYLTKFALPNFYFHLTMTYALLRQAGVDPVRLAMLRSFDPRSGAHPEDVEDPYYGTIADFEETFTVITAALPGLHDWVDEQLGAS